LIWVVFLPPSLAYCHFGVLCTGNA
jgi:hypothetical protein